MDIVTSPVLQGAAHGFLGRDGGVSAGIYCGLNVGLGSDDEPATILENRRIAKRAILAESELITVHQVHSADVAVVTEPIALEDRPHVDAMVTDQHGLLLGILTADCVPVLFFDAEAQVVGAAHAGWKGAIAGVVENTIVAMEGLGAKRDQIAAAIGPCIAQESYEVDQGFHARFIEQNPANAEYFLEGKIGHYQFDIEAFVASRLKMAAIGKYEKAELDTYALEGRYYSYRRSCHRNESSYGRQISLIGLGG